MLFDKLIKLNNAHCLFEKSDTVVVAVSGGPDSVCLLDLLVRLSRIIPIRIHVAHLNHGIRGKDADLDEQFVADLAGEYGLPHTTEFIDVPRLISGGGSLEAAAREVRYQFLRDVCKRTGAAKVATGHHQNDQVETVLLNLIRGAGMDGLSGMAFKSKFADKYWILRPLLSFTKEEIIDYSKKRGLKWRLDRTNLGVDYTRNRVRLELIPLLSQFNEEIVETLARTADVLRGDNTVLTGLVKDVYNRAVVSEDDNHIVLSVCELAKEQKPIQRRLIRLAVQRLAGGLEDISLSHVDSVIELIVAETGDGQVDLPGRLRVLRSHAELVITNKIDRKKNFKYQLRVPGKTVIPEAAIVLSAVVRPAQRDLTYYETESPNKAFFDWDKISLPLVVRSREPGDRFCPFGLGGTKKLQDFFIDEKIPRYKRDEVALMESGSGIMWVIGIRTDDRFKITGNTDQVLEVEAAEYLEGGQNSGEKGEGDSD